MDINPKKHAALQPIAESEDYERGWRIARANLCTVIGQLAEFLAQHLDRPIYVNRKLGLFAWQRPVSSTDACQLSRLYFFGIHLYNSFTYRISICASDRSCLPKHLCSPTQTATSASASFEKLPSRVELSFVADDLEQVKSPELVKFVESIFDCGTDAAYPWTLFASDRSFPAYAWSIVGEAEYQSRRKGTQMVRERRPLLPSLLRTYAID